MEIRRAPASMAFSTSSFTTEAGRSTTSPAAIWLASSAGRSVMRPTSDPAPAPEEGQHQRDDGGHDGKEPPELRVVAPGKPGQRHVHTVDAGEQGERHEHSREDREHL